MQDLVNIVQEIVLIERGEPNNESPHVQVTERSWFFDPNNFNCIETKPSSDNTDIPLLQQLGGFEIDEFEIGVTEVPQVTKSSQPPFRPIATSTPRLTSSPQGFGGSVSPIPVAPSSYFHCSRPREPPHVTPERPVNRMEPRALEQVFREREVDQRALQREREFIMRDSAQLPPARSVTSQRTIASQTELRVPKINGRIRNDEVRKPNLRFHMRM